ncbi:MAG: DUF1329 domain-containing protein [Actinobacteria bacterium]|nr:DUF1329 domain-containing protein [Actinomycetota bacterium]
MKKLRMVASLRVVALSALLLAQPSLGAVSADEAKQLGATLTEFGAEVAGNKDGSIPAYTGGIEKVAGYTPKTSQRYVDPFAKEKPLYSVDAKNMAEYDAMLTEGTKALMRRHSDYRIDVYPTHRSVRYAPWVLENTLKNATTVKLSGQVMGDAVTGADKGNLPFPGLPFPIPKNGYEVMWNYKMHYGPAVTHFLANAFLVDTAGNMSRLPQVDHWLVRPWYDKAGKMRAKTFDALSGFSATLTDPPSSAGTVFLNYYLATAETQKVWFYTPGQRRVRQAPEFSYDVPIASYGGVIVWDELFGFVGRMDRFDFKLVGKKEMLVPYNVFGATNTMTHQQYVGRKFVKPEGIRFEKHRVWVVEATRKPKARHAYSRRIFYIDEDAWCITISESYDNAGKIWRVTNTLNYPPYDIGGVNDWGWATYDLIKGNYFIIDTYGDPGSFVHSYDTGEGLPIRLTPSSVAAGGVR